MLRFPGSIDETLSHSQCPFDQTHRWCAFSDSSCHSRKDLDICQWQRSVYLLCSNHTRYLVFSAHMLIFSLPTACLRFRKDRLSWVMRVFFVSSWWNISFYWTRRTRMQTSAHSTTKREETQQARLHASIRENKLSKSGDTPIERTLTTVSSGTNNPSARPGVVRTDHEWATTVTEAWIRSSVVSTESNRTCCSSRASGRISLHLYHGLK